MRDTADVVIIGAGVIGCSTAYHLARLGIGNVAVVEMGQPGSGTTSKSASMLSLQFCHDELQARMAQISYARYMQFEEEIGVPIDFRRTGWLSLATATSAERLRVNAERLQRLGIATEILAVDDVRHHYPQLNVEDVVLATWGPDDGPFDPHMIVWGYVKRAAALGVRFHQGVRATGIVLSGERVTGVQTDHGPIAAPVVVNAGGPWAGEIGRWVGVEIPLLNLARTIVVTGSLPAIPRDWPFVEDVAAEWYVRPEGAGVLMGMGREPTEDLCPAPRPEMINAIIDAAVHRVPALAHATLLTAWTGVRPLTSDDRPIVGLAPGVKGLVLNCGWGGTGIIQAPVAGQLAAEVVAYGRGVTLDVTAFDVRRFDRPLRLAQQEQRSADHSRHDQRQQQTCQDENDPTRALHDRIPA